MDSRITSLLYGFCLILLFSCGDQQTTESSETEQTETEFKAELPEHFQYERVNDQLVYAYHKPDEFIRAEGYLTNGRRHGYWFYYYQRRHKIQKIEHLVRGKLHGTVKEYSLNGRLEKLAHYKNGVLDGTYTEYKFGKLLVEAYYKNGNLDGEKRIYFDANEYRGKIQQKIHYKDGVKHGLHQYFNEDREVVLENKYENGERIEEGE